VFGRSLWSRIALTYAALTIVCVGAISLYMLFIGRDSYLAVLNRDVEVEARMLSAAARPLISAPSQLDRIDQLAKQLGPEAGVRITIIDSAGQVLGDSDEDPSVMMNHASRPEVANALSGQVGRDSRRSPTLGQDTLYVAVPISAETGPVLGVARVAMPLSQVNMVYEQIALAVLLGGAVATLLAAALAVLLAKNTTGPIEELTSIASQIAEGDLDQRVWSYSETEVGRLARAFNQMADRLRDTVKAITSERDSFATVLATMADGTVIVDRKGRVVQANRAAGLLLRMPVTGMEGRSFVEVLRDHQLSAVLQSCLEQGTQQTGTTEVGHEHRSLRIVATPLRGTKAGALALLQDLTEVRRVESVRRDFIANVSHELRTPLASLKALVETLEDGAMAEPEVARDFLSKMHREVDGLTQLVGELLELSRIESGQAALRPEPVAVERLIRGTVDRLVPQAERAGLSLSTGTDSSLPMVLADGQRVQQVLMNLIHNAIKFTPPGGEIVVGARLQEGLATVWVSDTGVGIAQEDLPRIFERFYKADRSRSGGGTGLGLAIAKHVVQAHGGRLWAESREGHGSTFYFTLPVA